MKRSSLGEVLGAVLPPVVLFAVVLLVWDGAVRALGIKPYALPSPGLVWQAIQRDFDKYFHAVRYTGSAALCGLGASLLIGTTIALIFSQSKWIRTSGYPYAIFLQTVPIVAIAPLIVLWCGRGFGSIVLVACIISLFPIIANVTTGLINIDHDLLDLFRLNTASRWQVLWKLRFPSAIPALCTGARTSAGMAVVGSIIGEFFTGHFGHRFGLGYLIQFASEGARTADLFACVFASTLLGVTIFTAVTLITSAILRRWYDTT